MCRSIFFTLILSLLAVSASAQTYRWIDPKTGATMITDTPPPGNAQKINRSQNESPADATGVSYATRRAMENFPVTLYTASDCPNECQEARALLNKRGIPFTEKTLQKPEDFNELKTLVGGAFVPSLKVGSHSIKGFQSDSYHQLLDQAGYPTTAPYGSKTSGKAAQ